MPTPMRVTRTPSGFSNFREVHRRGFAFRGRIRRHDDFFDGTFLQALDQGFDFELVRSAPLQR